MSAGLLELEEKTQALIHLDEARRLVDAFYDLDVSTFTDDQFALLESLIDKAIHILSSHPIAQHRPLIERLLVAREGVEQGMSPDPGRRPTLEQMRQFVAAHLSS